MFSGQTGAVLHTLVAPVANSVFGRSVAGAGDLDGDGFDDILVGAPGTGPGFTPQPVPGHAYAYSGGTGMLIYTINAQPTNDNMGCVVAGAGDLDADGTPDLVVSALYADPAGLVDAGRIIVYRAGLTLAIVAPAPGSAGLATVSNQFGLPNGP